MAPAMTSSNFFLSSSSVPAGSLSTPLAKTEGDELLQVKAVPDGTAVELAVAVVAAAEGLMGPSVVTAVAVVPPAVAVVVVLVEVVVPAKGDDSGASAAGAEVSVPLAEAGGVVP